MHFPRGFVTMRHVVSVLGILLLVGACAPASAGPAWTFPPYAYGTADPGASGGPASPDPAAAGEPLEIEAFDLGFKPASLEVPSAGRYEVKLVNTGAAFHDITFPTGEVASAQPGETASVEVDIPAEGTTFMCSIPGHAAAGMHGEVAVAGAAAPSDEPDSHGGPAPTTEGRTRSERPRSGPV
jgi:plastocyanin